MPTTAIGKEETLSRIKADGVVAVVRAESSDQALRVTEACLKGGVRSIEITYTVPGASKVIADLATAFPGGEITLGAGAVLDSETARAAILSGASYVVSPAFDEGTVRLCNRYRVPAMPGAMTIREVIMAMESGADIVKVFPGELFGPAFIKAAKAPLPQAQLMPTGGVSLDNVAEWIKAGAVAVGAGGQLTAGAKTGDYAAVEKTARAFMDAVRAAREALAKGGK